MTEEGYVEIEALIGCFVNTLVMRTNLSGNSTFQELLAQVREVALGAYAHQDVPFEKLVEELQPERDSSRSPLFQVMFILQNAPMPALEMADLTLSPLDIDNGTSKFDLLLSMEDTQQGLVGVWEYNTDLFDATTITRMTRHFQTLLEGIIAHPEQRVSHLPILSAAERHQLFVEWNGTIAEYPQNLCIHQLFEATVERSPDKVAVVFEDRQLTYGELNQRANQLAGYLKKCGVGSEDFVGICVERSPLMVVGVLAILKAGGTYVPLDPRYPKDRIAFVLEDTTAPVLLTQASLVTSLPANSARVVCLETDWEIIAQEDKENLRSEVNSENLAYTIYTSGSTGKPKGVQIPHRAAVNFLTSMSLTPGLTAQDILLSVTTISFDIAALEIFLPLTVGAQVVVASSEVASDGYALQELLRNSGATVMQATPATWRLLLEAGWSGCTNLKILCGGEAMPRTLASQLLQRVGSLWNMYGPTETTIWSTIHQVEKGSELISIGRPIANTQIYLLDSCGQPVPVGVPGELHIGGVGLAKGYLNRPELTAEKFIAHPYSNQPGDRLYKTGDLARYLPDGNIECLGRIDNQVKIRGFRIELGEIEAVLNLHPAVRESVVVGRVDLSGDKHLVAYIVASSPDIANQKQTLTTSELRSFLKEQLPEYMVPSAFVFLEALPLTLNGKVDRRALPMPELSRPELEKNFVAPQDPLELQLTKIWEEVLGIQPIGIRDNFFELGGHSLVAVRLFSEISKAFGKNLPLTTLFQSPTIEQLANILRSSGCDAPIKSLVPLKLGGDKPPLFCIYGILIYHDLALNLDSEQPVYGVYLQEEVDLLQAGRLEDLSALTSVTDLARRYLKEIQTLQPEGPYFLAGLSFGGLVALEMAQQLHMQGEKVALLALFDTPGPADRKKLPWQERVYFHLRNLLQQGSSYALKKAKRRISSSKKRLVSIMSTISRKFDPRSGHILPSYPQQVAELDVRQQVRDRAFRNYVPRPYPGKVIVFRAMDRDQFEVYDTDPQFGWGELAAGGLEVHDVLGDHIGILKEPHVQVLAERLRECLEQAQIDR